MSERRSVLRSLRSTKVSAICGLLCLGIGLFVLYRFAQTDVSRCAAAPTPACVLQQAVASALAIEHPQARYNAIRYLATARQGAERATSRAAFDAMVSALASGRVAERNNLSTDTSLRLSILSSIATAQLELGLPDEAAATLDGLRELAGPLPASGAFSLRTLGIAQARAGLKAEAAISFDRALRAMQFAPDQWGRANGSRLVAEALIAASMPKPDVALSQALRAAQEIQDDRTRIHALASIAATQSCAGLTDDAQRTFEQALQNARSLASTSTRNGALLEVARKLNEAGKQASAVATLDQALQDALAIPHSESRLAALSQTAEIYTSLGQTAQAAAAFAAAVKAAQAIASEEASDRPHRRERSAGEASAAAQRLAEIAAASAGFDKAEQMMRSHVAILNVATAQANAGLRGDAMLAFRQAPESFWIDAAALPAASSEHQKQVVARSSGWYDRWRAAALAAIAEAQAKSGLRQDAQAHFNEARRIAQTIADTDLRVAALLSVALSQLAIAAPGDKKLMEDALAVRAIGLGDTPYWLPMNLDGPAAEMIGTFVTVEPWFAKTATITDALLDGALSKVRPIRDSLSRDSNLRSVVAAAAAGGRIARAIELAPEVEEPEQRLFAWLSILKAMPRPLQASGDVSRKRSSFRNAATSSLSSARALPNIVSRGYA